MSHTLTLSGTYYRMKFLHEAEDVLGPVQSPEGRSHYDGQSALYLSETPEGCQIATRIYRTADDPPRGIFPLLVTGARVVDLRNPVATEALGIDTTHRQAHWQEIRKNGQRSPTWDISDRVRELGLDGMLYESRSKPSLAHLTLFRWNALGGPSVERTGDPLPDAIA